MKKIFAWALVLCMVFSVCAVCAFAEEKTAVMKIGAIHDLTGSGSVLGIAGKNGHELAIADINEAGGIKVGDTTYTLELIAYDCKSDPNEGISALTKLVQVDDVALVLGPSLSNVGLACVDTTDELGVAFLGQFGDPRCMLGDNLDTLNNWMFLMQPSASQSGIYCASYLHETVGCNKLGFIIAQDHSYCSTQAKAAIQYCEDMGIEYKVEYCNQADLDMKTQLTNLKNWGADGLFNACPTQPAVVVTEQRYQLGFMVPMSGSLDMSEPFNTLVSSPAALENIYVMYNVDSNKADFAELNAKHEAKYGTVATQKCAMGYDQVLIAAAAAQAAGSIDRAAIRDALENIAGVDTVITENFCMGADNHMPLGLDVCMFQIKDGQYVALGQWAPDYLK